MINFLMGQTTQPASGWTNPALWAQIGVMVTTVAAAIVAIIHAWKSSASATAAAKSANYARGK